MQDDLLTAYRTAADKKKQIKILAELNAVPVEEIIRRLEVAGEKVDKRGLTNPRKKPEITHSVPAGMEWLANVTVNGSPIKGYSIVRHYQLDGTPIGAECIDLIIDKEETKNA